MKKLLIILCLLSVNAKAQDFIKIGFRMKCASIITNNSFKGVLCEDDNNSCIIPENGKQQPFCIKK